MTRPFVILWMIFNHIVDDYYLQGWLASAKQKSWWEKNAPDRMYKYDYIWALIMHSFSWSFMITMPVIYFCFPEIDFRFIIIFILNIVFHALVDNAKANWKLINLWQDQLIHMVQIVATAIMLYI